MCYMEMTAERVGVRELRQNLSVYLERIARGETLQVTDRGVPVAILAPLPRPSSVLERLRAEGRVTPATGDLLALKRPRMPVANRGSRALAAQRQDRRL
jgi:antitoxin (DNA-binding transcriptional repressor) of toxin-antitoxin stability system